MPKLFCAGGAIGMLIATGSGDTLIGNGNGSTLQAGTGSSATTVAYSATRANVNLATGKVSVNGAAISDTLIGGIAIAIVSGTSDTVTAGSGTSTLIATGSGDTLIGGAAGTVATLSSNAGGNALQSGAGTAIVTYSGNNVTVNLSTGTAKVNGSSISDTLVGITRAMVTGSGDTLIAGSGTNTLTALGTGDTLIAGSGTATLVGSGTGEFYDYASGNGQTTIYNGGSGGTGPSNELDFGGALTDQNLWLLQSGNDLQIEIMGSTSKVTVNGWFASSASRLQEITSGGLKLDTGYRSSCRRWLLTPLPTQDLIRSRWGRRPTIRTCRTRSRRHGIHRLSKR